MRSYSKTLPARWIRCLSIAAALFLLAGYAEAGIVTYSGQDDGALIGGPFPLSTAAQTSFMAAASGLGPISTITFENLALGFYSPIAAAPGVSVTLAAPNYGDGFSGISTTTYGNLYGFNVTPGGSKWLGSPGGAATFAFSSPTQSFGLWLTGVQTVFTSTFTLTFFDGSSETLSLPINVDGGAAYFGFTDAGALISSITITNQSNDAWGIDDVTYSSAVPEPSTLLLLGGALPLLGLAYRRR